MSEFARLRKELLDIGRDASASGVVAEPVGGDMSHWRGTVNGPSGTPYGESSHAAASSAVLCGVT